MKKRILIATLCILNLANFAQAEDLPTITNSKIGDLSASSQYSTATIEPLFPSYQVKLDTYMAEGDEYSSIVVKDGEQEVAEFFGNGEGGYRDAYIYSPLILDANGVQVGMQAQKLPDSVLAKCSAGVEAAAENLICNFSITPNIQYWIDGNKMNANKPTLTQKSKIYAIRWLSE